MVTKAKFQAFEKVRLSGLTNMYDLERIRFISASKYGTILTDKDCFDCMINYDKYVRKYLVDGRKWKER